MTTAIRVENISKRYKIGIAPGKFQYGMLRDQIVDAAQAPFRLAASLLRRSNSESRISNPASYIWALKDVSFDLEEGHVLGIIGRNGAGKSTLLKVLSRVTEPTRGTVSVRGRVGSLLEVGTGFHPELTGRENIYLNGAILGMKRKEIEAKFDEIVEFSEVSQFIDTPVKRYSSGMYLRLAFAVAAHLEPEILVVDEVLAVGDAEFQRKCLGKMNDVAAQGRTVLFVSHNMSAILRLSQEAIVMQKGQLVMRAPTPEAVASVVAPGESEGQPGRRRQLRRQRLRRPRTVDPPDDLVRRPVEDEDPFGHEEERLLAHRVEAEPGAAREREGARWDLRPGHAVAVRAGRSVQARSIASSMDQRRSHLKRSASTARSCSPAVTHQRVTKSSASPLSRGAWTSRLRK